MRVVVWAKEIVGDRRTIILDTETTGLGDRAEVVELALLGVDGQVHFNSLLRPSRARVESGARRVHGIGDRMLVGAPGLDEVWEELEPLLQRSRVVVYNARFDRRLLRQSVAAAGLTDRHGSLRRHWECAMLQYASLAYAVGHSRYHRWQKLDEACRQMRVATDGTAHRALGDCQRTLGLLHKVAALA